jgi:hypothetical protein
MPSQLQAELWPHAARSRSKNPLRPGGSSAGICVPEEFGGAQLDYLTLALVVEKSRPGDGGTSTVISVTNSRSTRF